MYGSTVSASGSCSTPSKLSLCRESIVLKCIGSHALIIKIAAAVVESGRTGMLAAGRATCSPQNPPLFTFYSTLSLRFVVCYFLFEFCCIA
ncbi:hypothetical protein CEXT_522291 [Caerostris extrusa]|uniref:Uncharacterized protein n=1 Tax=Caerostris extrusa TaxID=172846 RepID=A0AAV4M6F5_CAEEX|nr:hypothetical protein CEXT_522291 [Caerostris extrusa]